MICRARCLAENLTIVMDEKEREASRDQIMCYLLHHAAERLSHDTLHNLNRAIKYGGVHVGTHVWNKLLICSILLDEWGMFNASAHLYPTEPSLEIFSILNRAFASLPIHMEDVELGFRELLKKLFVSKQLPDALLAIETHEGVKSNPEGLIATWINNCFHEIETGTGLGAGLLGFQEAASVIRICVRYQDGFDRTKQSALPRCELSGQRSHVSLGCIPCLLLE